MPTIDKIIIRLLLERYLTKKELSKYAPTEKMALNHLQRIQQRKEIPIKKTDKGYCFDGERARKDAESYLFFKYDKSVSKLHWKTFPELYKRILYYIA